MPNAQVLASIVPGAMIAGRYSVEHALGKGGMGTVYAVRDTSTGRSLALKYLQREAALENGPAAALFQREYHTLAHLRHPRVIRVHDYGVDGGRPYYTMELLDGSDLRELAPLPWVRACRLLRDVASSLALLHSRRMLHRDLSPRNVRCTRDGQAKLLDFGTMTPMGMARDVAGTPPYMAPEAIHCQTLDARTDLYAFGALAYWTLTGHDAYPARDARELRQLWPRAILPPSAFAPGVPEPLDALVMSLLSLDPQVRPSHAAEVIERLGAIAGLPSIDHAEVARAYLSSPTLIGHADTLQAFRMRLLRATRGRGSSVLVRGAPGSGRSRVLQALVLEAKLGGITVLSAGAEEGGGAFGLMGALIARLVESAPDVALDTFRPHAPVLGAMFADLRAQLGVAPPLRVSDDPREAAAQALQAMREWLLTAARARPLMIAVDDADHADEPSVVCLTLLAGDARAEQLLVAASVEAEVERPALEVLATDAVPIDIAPLVAEETARLLRSVFGDVPNLQVVAEWVHSLSQGNPRTAMELAQYLVDRGLACYERGSFMLPETLRDQALPTSIEQALDDLLDHLSPPARALAEALCLVSEHGHLELEEIVRLSGWASPHQTYGAIDELVAAQVVVAAGAKHHLRHRGLARALQRAMSDARRGVLHLRLACAYEGHGARGQGIELRLLGAHHRYLGGDMEGCLDALAEVTAGHEAAFVRTREAAQMYEACLEHFEAAGLSPARLYPLRKMLLWMSSTVDPEMIKHAGPTLAQLRLDSGRAYFDEILDERDPIARIRRCIDRARLRHQQADEVERGLPPLDAIHELGACVLMLTETYVLRNDPEALARLPDLIEPFRPFSPLLGLLKELSTLALDSLLGRDVASRRATLLSRLELPVEGLEPRSRHAIVCTLHYWLGMDDAAMAKGSALDHAVELERFPLYAPLGAQVRGIYHLFSGNEEEADVWQRKRERLALQGSFAVTTSTHGVIYEALGYFMCGSVLGMRRALATARKLALRHPGWKRTENAIEGLYSLLRGEPAAALPLLALDAAGRVQALVAIGDVRTAVAFADAALTRHEREADHPLQLQRLRAARALAWSASGEHEAAAASLDADIARAEGSSLGGMLLCVMHEARARIAIEMDDRESFRRHVRKLGATYGRGASALRARYEQLGVVARRALLSMPPAQQSARAEVRLSGSSDVRTLFESGLSQPDRLQRALAALARRANTSRGYLFGMQAKGLQLAASLGDGSAPEGLEDMLAVYLSAELDPQAAASTGLGTITGTFPAAPELIAWINDGHSLYYPVLLSCVIEQSRVVAGVAVLALPVQRDPGLPADLVADVSRALIEAGDVIGVNAAD
ncbi:MAG: protein kinase [Polyangiales bacterium]